MNIDKTQILIFPLLMITGCIVVFFTADYFAVCSFLFGFLIVVFDLMLLYMYLKKIFFKSTYNVLNLISRFRLLLTGFFIYLSLVWSKLSIFYFITGLLMPFICVIIAGICEIKRRKEDGITTSS